MSNLKIELDPREDKEGQIYYLGKVKTPIDINCRKGITFLVFLSEEGEEELQIAPLDKEHRNFSQYSKRDDRLKISLSARKDQSDRVYYVGKIQLDGVIDCGEGASFLVFISKKGFEELQIVAPVRYDEDKPKVIETIVTRARKTYASSF